MKNKNRIKKNLSIAVLLLTSAALCGCGDTNQAKDPQTDFSDSVRVESIEEESSVKNRKDTLPSEASTESANQEGLQAHTESENDESSNAASSADPNGSEHAKIRHRYGELLSQFVETQELPELGEVEDPYDIDWDMGDNTYALCDVDGDDREELIITYSTASMAGMFTAVYGYTPETDTLTLEFTAFPAVHYYDNGILLAYASHNHSYGDFWPVGFYQYDTASNSYQQIGYADTWDKTYRETFFDYETEQEMPFPTDLDTDNDGILYNIQKGSPENYSWEYEDYQYNENDYHKWYNSFMSDAAELILNYQAIQEENYQIYLE